MNEGPKDAARNAVQAQCRGPLYYNPGHTYYGHSYSRANTFRPYVSIGFGVFSGYAVPFTYRYRAPIIVYGYRAPRVPDTDTWLDALRRRGARDGPYDADVFVDGSYAERVEDFDGTTQPLTLVAGTHRIKVRRRAMRRSCSTSR